MILGYACVPIDLQDLTSQLAQLRAAGCEHVCREKTSRENADRPQLKKLLAAVTHGDLLVIARELKKARADLRSIAEPLIDTISDFKEVILAMLGVSAKLERRRIRERTERGRIDTK